MSSIFDMNWLLTIEELEMNEELDIVRKSYDSIDNFELPDRIFQKLFRLSKPLADEFIAKLDPFLEEARIDSETKILCALRFFATGSNQLNIGEHNSISLSQSSVSRAIHEVINAVHDSELFMEKIRFPSTLNELEAVADGFYDKFKFPGVIGTIDCTHVAITPPKKDDPLYPEHIFVNRKGYHSINVQLVCDSELRILHVNAKFPGSTNDSYIWNKSNLQTLMKSYYERLPTRYHLLGDSGYTLQPWLLTPFETTPQEGSHEANYNIHHIRTRNTIERCIDVLKNRFRCLLKHQVLHYHPVTSAKIINTAFVLHNMCTNADLELPKILAENDGVIDPNPADTIEESNALLKLGRQRRSDIVQEYFS